MTSSTRPTAHLTEGFFRQILIRQRVSFYRKTATTEFTIKGKKSRKYQSSKYTNEMHRQLYEEIIYIQI